MRSPPPQRLHPAHPAGIPVDAPRNAKYPAGVYRLGIHMEIQPFILQGFLDLHPTG